MNQCSKNRIIVMSIMSYYARQIFNKTKEYEFRKSPLKEEDLNKKIYIYSAKEDKAIIGYVKVSDIIMGNTSHILKVTGYDKRSDGSEIVDYYGYDFQRCCALKLYDVMEFKEYLTLKDMRKIDSNIRLPQYYSYIYENHPLYDVINNWDQAFHLGGNVCHNSKRKKQCILKEGILKKRK